MALLLDRERERYLAYECKRLNVTRSGSTRSLATQYVLEGVTRFVSQQYAADLPLGCMLGYVMDGNVKTARRKVRAAMAGHCKDVALVWGPVNDRRLGVIERMSSRHLRSPAAAPIEIRHALLPFVLGGQGTGGGAVTGKAPVFCGYR